MKILIIEDDLSLINGLSFAIKKQGYELDIARTSCKTYDEFIDKMSNITASELNYFGIGICGTKKKVNKLTGN